MDTRVIPRSNDVGGGQDRDLIIGDEALQFFDRLMKQGGPNPVDYDDITRISRKILASAPNLTDPLRVEIADRVREVCLEGGDLYGSLTGLAARAKPRGKYSVIAGIYSEMARYRDLTFNGDKLFNPTPTGERFDAFFFQNPAARALIGRNDYFNSEVKKIIDASKEKVRLLNAASGPAIDLKRLYEALDDPDKLETVCVDNDGEAIAFAQAYLGKFVNSVKFEKRNILRYRSDQRFDVIWSAGLFDYLEETPQHKTFTSLLASFKGLLKDKGKVIIGNFDEDNNPSRAYMEVFCLWYLYHRTDSQLIEYAQAAGFSDAHVEKESVAKVNSFLVATK